MNSFMVVYRYFFLAKYYKSAVLSLTNKLSLCLFKPIFGQGGCYFACDKTVYLQLAAIPVRCVF